MFFFCSQDLVFCISGKLLKAIPRDGLGFLRKQLTVLFREGRDQPDEPAFVRKRGRLGLLPPDEAIKAEQ